MHIYHEAISPSDFISDACSCIPTATPGKLSENYVSDTLLKKVKAYLKPLSKSCSTTLTSLQHFQNFSTQAPALAQSSSTVGFKGALIYSTNLWPRYPLPPLPDLGLHRSMKLFCQERTSCLLKFYSFPLTPNCKASNEYPSKRVTRKCPTFPDTISAILKK